MVSTPSHARTHALAALAVALLLAACADTAPVGPRETSAPPAQGAQDLSPEQLAATYDRPVELGSCDTLKVPAGSKLDFHVFATGVQIYRWSGTSWVFVAPLADLFADAGGSGKVGTHFGGPTWETVSGSTVVGTVTHRCTPDPNAIPWLRLDAVSSGAGVFEKTRFIQRVNTVGGKAPAAPGTVTGQEVRVPYAADYFFYRAP
jgi:hypothetical protein